MDPEIVGAGIGAASGIIGDVANLFGQSKANKQSEEWQEKMYGMQRADALSDWNRQNAYNSPTSIMQRYQEAGLNPKLIYGNSGNPSPAIRSSSPGSYTAQPLQLRHGPQAVGEAFSQVYQLKQQKAQTNNLLAQNAVIAQEAIMKALLTQKTANDIKKQEANLPYVNELAKSSADAARNMADKLYYDANNSWKDLEFKADSYQDRLDQIAANLKKTVAERDLKQSQKDAVIQAIDNMKKDGTLKEFEIKLNKEGVTKGDDLWQRLLGLIMGKIGIHF